MRRATHSLRCHAHFLTISIHALHEESDVRTPETTLTEEISIHALHEESDYVSCDMFCMLNISIHALHEESDALVELEGCPWP